jgi:hypothetical protein
MPSSRSTRRKRPGWPTSPLPWLSSPDLAADTWSFSWPSMRNEREDGYCVMDGVPAAHDDDLAAMALAIGRHKNLYGGVKECRLDGDVLTFRLSWKARRMFRWPRTLKLKLAVPADQREALLRGLPAVFAVAPQGERPPRVFV